MKVGLLGDENLNRAIEDGVRRRSPEIDFLSHDRAGLDGLDDDAVLDLAASAGRVLVTHDKGISVAAARRLAEGKPGAGVIIVRTEMGVGKAIVALAQIWEKTEAEDWLGQVVWLQRNP